VKRVACAAVCILGPAALTAGGQEASTAGVPREIPGVHQALETAVKSGEVAGAVAVVAGPDGVLAIDSAGDADLGTHRPMTPETIFWIASMTKPVTAAAVLMLQDQGKLSIDDQVSKYLPEFKNLKGPDGKPVEVTIKQLLTHTSGLAEIDPDPISRIIDLEGTTSYHVSKPTAFAPGSKWAYCQSGINTAGRIVEVVAKQNFARFLDQKLLKPLGMNDTAFYLTDAQMPRLATSYSKAEGGGLEPANVWLLYGKSPTSRDRFPAPNGGLFSTPNDYARFARMLLNGGVLDGKRYLSADAVKLMSTIQTGDLATGFTPGNGWGIGCCVIKEPQGPTAMLSPGTFGHGGAFGTQAWIDPVAKRAYLLFVQRSNFPNADASDLRRDFQKAAVEALGKK
jgi:CubicO group peptidase (beta-lactamase class C family)